MNLYLKQNRFFHYSTAFDFLAPENVISYLWEILGQWDILLLNLTSIDFLDVSSLSFFTSADVLKMRHLKKIRETNGGKIKEQDVPLT